MTDKYNGYTNYETWLMIFNIDNEQWIYEEIQRIIHEQPQEDNYETGQVIKDFIENTFYIEEHGIYKICDTWTERDFQEIDWEDIAKTERAE